MSEFVNYLHEVFTQFGPISTRKMFGGHGIYHQGLMFALVADDELYLKVDKQNRPHFDELGLLPFEYQKNGKPFTMSYHQAPEELFDDPDVAAHWANLAYGAALRAKRKK